MSWQRANPGFVLESVEESGEFRDGVGRILWRKNWYTVQLKSKVPRDSNK
jgi:hypothetical protein